MENVIEILTEGRIDQKGIEKIQLLIQENKKLQEGFAFSREIGWYGGRDHLTIRSKEELKDSIYEKYQVVLEDRSDLKVKVRELEEEITKLKKK